MNKKWFKLDGNEVKEISFDEIEVNDIVNYSNGGTHRSQKMKVLKIEKRNGDPDDTIAVAIACFECGSMEADDHIELFKGYNVCPKCYRTKRYDSYKGEDDGE